MQPEKQVNVLLVDDHPENLLALEAILENLNLNLVKASSGEQALKCLLKQDFAVILLDVQMPGMDGFETAKLIRERERCGDIPIIFLTAFSTNDNKVFQGYSLGAVDYLLKPIQAEILKSKVVVFVELFKKTAQIEAMAAQLVVVNNELENRVQKRTAELTCINTSLQAEITHRQRVESQLKASLEEKEVLLKEIHHRVKNNLQIIDGLLQLQARRTPAQQAAVLLESQHRIKSIALVHEKLYLSEDLAKINFAEYARNLISSLFDSYQISSNSITSSIYVDNIELDIDTAIPCGLIINELVSNALKYAFPDERNGEIRLEFHANEPQKLTLIVQDDGVGIPEQINLQKTRSLGLKLVQGLARQLDGTIEIEYQQGTLIKITFPSGKA